MKKSGCTDIQNETDVVACHLISSLNETFPDAFLVSGENFEKFFFSIFRRCNGSCLRRVSIITAAPDLVTASPHGDQKFSDDPVRFGSQQLQHKPSNNSSPAAVLRQHIPIKNAVVASLPADNEVQSMSRSFHVTKHKLESF